MVRKRVRKRGRYRRAYRRYLSRLWITKRRRNVAYGLLPTRHGTDLWRDDEGASNDLPRSRKEDELFRRAEQTLGANFNVNRKADHFL
jgi:hypothetical protein